MKSIKYPDSVVFLFSEYQSAVQYPCGGRISILQLPVASGRAAALPPCCRQVRGGKLILVEDWHHTHHHQRAVETVLDVVIDFHLLLHSSLCSSYHTKNFYFLMHCVYPIFQWDSIYVYWLLFFTVLRVLIALPAESWIPLCSFGEQPQLQSLLC